ncbi:MAG: patatin-like phospholipase family protein [Pyrinomonadaceae bacterium]
MPSPADDANPFNEVFADELNEIQQRRTKAFDCPAETPRNLAGLALSGGGIRSATFCLGVLQGLNNLGLLKMFDYLSTVSGGGFAGGWWSAWLAREGAQTTFPPTERIEPERSKNYSQGSRSGKLAEGSISAGADPIHHLRLFANYLTPRRGALSMDSWRAIGLIVRNLLMTWSVLLPVLLAAVLFGQLYFAFFTRDFPHENQAEIQETISAQEHAHQVVATLVHKPSTQEQLQLRKQTLKTRAWAAAVPVMILSAITAFFAFCWMIGIQGGPGLVRLMNAGIGALLLNVLAVAFLGPLGIGLVAVASFLGFLAVIVIVFRVGSNVANFRAWLGESRKKGGGLTAFLRRAKEAVISQLSGTASRKSQRRWEKEVYLNRMTRWMVRFLIATVLVAAVLAVAGFGHEAVEYVCCYDAPGGTVLGSVIHYITKSISITSLFAAFAGLIYTWGKATPTGGGDKSETHEPSATSRAIFAITPPLAISVLAVIMAWLAHGLVSLVIANQPDSTEGLTVATRLGIYFAFFLVLLELDLTGLPANAVKIFFATLIVLNFIAVGWLFFADGEFFTIPQFSLTVLVTSGAIVIAKWKAGADIETLGWLPYVVVGAFVYLAGAVAYRLVPKPSETHGDSKWLLMILVLVTAFAILKPLVRRIRNSPRFTQKGRRRYVHLAAVVLRVIAFLGILLLVVIVIAEKTEVSSLGSSADPAALDSAFKGIVRVGVIFLVLAFFQAWKLRSNHRSSWLASCLLITLAMLVLLLNSTGKASVAAVALLATTALTWVITVGWVLDPNALSIHSFYRGRLVRAYLGASNPVREQKKKEVTEAVEGDDVLLSDLQNCRRGGPYHVINTTLNLAGGRDLVTAQRSSAMFVLSKNYCGSFRTRYRKTSEYMGGELSLGTALAISGAAVAPNMGSMKTTASLAMLMTLLNVRLGYWAPTPNKDAWYSPQARLWPYYVLREFLSETTDLSSYCYLTDGGHFDNSGLYSLVERGCQYVLVVDGSADPTPCFADLGNAVRRCRIDFGAEIDIDITPLIKISKDDKFPRTNHVVGSIQYSEAHFLDLDRPKDDRTGVIVYIKPGLVERQQSLPVDVRQYAIENASFPHETTADQWFDEAQFESYRALGEQSAQFLIESLNVSQSQLYKSALRKEKAHQKLNEEETNALGALAVSQKITQKTLTLQDVPGLFHSLQGLKSA